MRLGEGEYHRGPCSAWVVAEPPTCSVVTISRRLFGWSIAFGGSCSIDVVSNWQGGDGRLDRLFQADHGVASGFLDLRPFLRVAPAA